MTFLLIAAGNVALLFSIFPVEGYFFGFPIMYIVPILFGWFGILFLTLVANSIGNKIDTAIAEDNKLEEEEEERREKEEGA